jgi:hypothetical protein
MRPSSIGPANFWCPACFCSTAHFSMRILLVTLMETVCTSITLVNFYKTAWCSTLEGCHLHSRHREYLKSHRYSSCSRRLCWQRWRFKSMSRKICTKIWPPIKPRCLWMRV